MTMSLKTRAWIETVIAALSGFLFLLTLVWRDWIEKIFGWDPDHHSGSLEWILVGALLVVALGFRQLARSSHRRLATT
jgi:hypothetical protein